MEAIRGDHGPQDRLLQVVENDQGNWWQVYTNGRELSNRFNEKPTSSPKDIANKFNKQFTTSKLGIHSSSHETRYVSREVRKKSQETAPIFTTAMVTNAIKSCLNSRAFGPDLLSILHLKNLGPRATEYLISHSHPQARQRLFSGHIIPTNLTTLPSREGYGGPHLAWSQQPPATISWPTRIPTSPLDHLCSTPAHNRHRHRFQPTEATSSNTWQQRSIQFAITLWYPRLQDQHFRHLLPDGCHATSVVDKQEPAAEESNQVQGLSTQASLKDKTCHHRYSAST